ncbi:hypothetical protein NKG94_48300 [Micromonospora sp. M12]
MTLTAPMGTDTNLRGAGWLSWTARTAYLSVADLGVPDRRTLLRRDAAGLVRLDLPAVVVDGGAAEAPARPPLPPRRGMAGLPVRRGRPEPAGRDGGGRRVDRATGTAVRVREDVVAGRTVDVVESGPTQARLRYWIDRDGSLRRLELRTDAGAWAHLNLHPPWCPAWLPPPSRHPASQNTSTQSPSTHSSSTQGPRPGTR